MGWRDYAKEVQGVGDKRDNRDKSPRNRPIGPNVPNVPPLDPLRAVKLCSAGLGGLDLAAPLHGLDRARWRRLCDDADWLLVHFGQQAFRDGWTVGELFGLWWHGGMLVHLAGGIADRLDGARSLKLCADRAVWRPILGGSPMSFNRTAYPDLRPLWEPAP